MRLHGPCHPTALCTTLERSSAETGSTRGVSAKMSHAELHAVMSNKSLQKGARKHVKYINVHG
jgi:hypothetical protein